MPHGRSRRPSRDPYCPTRALPPLVRATGWQGRPRTAAAQARPHLLSLRPAAHFGGRRAARAAPGRWQMSARASRAHTPRAPSCRAQRCSRDPRQGSRRASSQRHRRQPRCHAPHPPRDAEACAAAQSRCTTREGSGRSRSNSSRGCRAWRTGCRRRRSAAPPLATRRRPRWAGRRCAAQHDESPRLGRC